MTNDKHRAGTNGAVLVSDGMGSSAHGRVGVVPVGVLVLERTVGLVDDELARLVGLGDLLAGFDRVVLEVVVREHPSLMSNVPVAPGRDDPIHLACHK